VQLVVRGPAVLRSSPHAELILRPGGGRRRLTALDPADAATYRMLVARVAPAVERSLGPAVVANRVASPRPPLGGRPVEDRWLEDWRVARGRWRRALAPAGRGLRLHLDVADCYGSIRPEVVAETLGLLGSPPDHRLIRLLHELADHAAGLPVGPEASAVLANAVLRRLDLAIADAGVPHVRWVDDLVIAVRSRRHATQMLDEARRGLCSLGLRVQDAKTRVTDARAILLGAPSSVAVRMR
jgi:hypothetical protein